MEKTLHDTNENLDCHQIDDLFRKLETASKKEVFELSQKFTEAEIDHLKKEWRTQTSIALKQFTRKKIKFIADHYNVDVNVIVHIACKLLISFAATDRPEAEKRMIHESMLYRNLVDNLRLLFLSADR